MFILLLKLHIHLFRSKIKNNLSFRVQLLGKVLYLNDFNKLNYGRGYKIQAYYAGADTIQRCGPVWSYEQFSLLFFVVHLGHKSFTLLQRAVTTDTHEVKCECRTVMVGYDLATKEPKLISEDYKEAICRYEEKTLEELSKG